MSEELKKKIVEVLETITDPEIGIDVYNLGLIYDIQVVNDKTVKITMSFTTMFCPLASTLPLMIIDALKEKLGIDADIDIVYDPPWTPLRMTEKGRVLFKERFGYDIVEEYVRSQQETRE
ncbi:MAG: metal-sulfur cluster assembly factor [Desulfurococcus sp.]|uniref:metal-sulfur cluster assembly factor n=1 Tax=Desulfurococcus sp. TaxID=51678 RepID=UPI003D0E5986